ncbi:hypothetical protein BGX38DRAFT_1274230 [Terfezia claveryi]|nr:hypothetical protein BGX38DRAFT_1274230 [Terfezia claveryi]
MPLPTQGAFGRLVYQIASQVTARGSYNSSKVQFITKKLRPLSTTTGCGSEIYAQRSATLRRGVQNFLRNPTTLHAPYSTIPDSYPRNPAAWSRWAVKLLLHWDDPEKANGLSAIGSGFFVNIPGAKKDIVFTAGHNLLNKDGIYVKAVDVIIDGKPAARVKTLGEDFHISESYKRTPNDTNPIDDYGCLLIERAKINDRDVPREGFGFSIPLAFADLRGMGLKAFVGGYPGELNIGDNVEFRYALGDFGQTDPGQLFYHASTEKGQSGGPVWVLYKGYETVVGIHNHDQRVEGSGNRATRLDIDTLYEIYKWAGVGAYDKSIKVVSYKGAQSLYLKALGGPAGGTYAHLGKQGIATTFDIIPAHTAPTDAGRAPRFALVNRPSPDPKTWLWLHFNVDPKARPRQVSVKTRATEDGMVRLHTAGAVKPEFDKNIYQIEATSLSEKPPSPRDPRYLLRIEGKGIPTNIEPWDDTEPESTDVQLVDVQTGDTELTEFTKLKLE